MVIFTEVTESALMTGTITSKLTFSSVLSNDRSSQRPKCISM